MRQSVSQSVHLPVSQWDSPSASPSVCQSVRQSVSQWDSPSVSPSVRQSVSEIVRQSIHPSGRQSVNQSVRLLVSSKVSSFRRPWPSSFFTPSISDKKYYRLLKIKCNVQSPSLLLASALLLLVVLLGFSLVDSGSRHILLWSYLWHMPRTYSRDPSSKPEERIPVSEPIKDKKV